MRIPREVVEEVRHRTDIVELIGSYVTLKRAGSNFGGLCPFHSEKTPSFTVFPDSESFYCFGCGAGGDVISFIMRAENLDYRDAVEYLAKLSGIPIEEEENGRAERQTVNRDRIYGVTKTAARFFVAALNSPQGEKARQYLLEKRKFSPTTLRRFGIGYAPDSWTALVDALPVRNCCV